MQTQNRLLDDLARVATGALGVAAGMRVELEVVKAIAPVMAGL